MKTANSLASRIANMEKLPTLDEWAELQEHAAGTVVQSVKRIINGDSVKATTFASLTEEQKEMWEVAGVADIRRGMD